MLFSGLGFQLDFEDGKTGSSRKVGAGVFVLTLTSAAMPIDFPEPADVSTTRSSRSPAAQQPAKKSWVSEKTTTRVAMAARSCTKDSTIDEAIAKVYDEWGQWNSDQWEVADAIMRGSQASGNHHKSVVQCFCSTESGIRLYGFWTY